MTSEDELRELFQSYHKFGHNGGSSMQYRDYLEFIVLPLKKEKLREKVLKRSGLKGAASQALKNKKAKKSQDEAQSTSGVSAVSKETSNSVERRKEEEAARISVDFAMAQVFE